MSEKLGPKIRQVALEFKGFYPNLTSNELVAQAALHIIGTKSCDSWAQKGIEDKELNRKGALVVNSPAFISGKEKILYLNNQKPTLVEQTY